MDSVEALALPCMPRAVALLMSELLSDTPNLRRVNQLFASDPVLALRLLELANAPALRMSGLIGGLPQAIAMLGTRQLRSLLRSARVSGGSAGLNLPQFWRCSQETARLSRVLASLLRLDGSTAYAVGLLHGVGQLVWAVSQPERALALESEVAIWDPRRPHWEGKTWGCHASSLSATLLRQAHAPALLIDSLRGAEEPLAQTVMEPLACVLHLALWRVRAQAAGWSARQLAVSFPSEVGVALGLDMDVVLQQDSIDWNAQGEY